MFEQNPERANPHTMKADSQTTAECARVAGDLKARAGRYRRLAESLFDANIIAVVLACARELETQAEVLIQGQPNQGN